MCRALSLLPILALLFVGCDAPQATFVTSDGTRNLPTIAQVGGTKDGKEFKGIEDVLEENFGTPHDLVAWTKLPVNYGGTDGETLPEAPEGFSLSQVSEDDLAEVRAKPGYHLAAGRALYMEHCLHCHGTSGDGNGPTAQYLNPLPRDYRDGIFKFTSTGEGKNATRKDLTRVIKRGIPGTYMPSFMLLKDEEVSQIVEYVRWLAMRGQVEKALVAELSADFSEEAIKQTVEGGTKRSEVMGELRTALTGLPAVADDLAGDIADAWTEADTDEALITPSVARIPDSEDSRRRGRAVFISANAKCTNCHGHEGLGNGKQTEEYEANPNTGKKWDEPGLHDRWGHIIQPRNLTRGIYRGGRRPIDIFRRVRAGIKGSGMPAFNTSVISDEDLWHLVNYVKSIPFDGQQSEPETVEPKTGTPTESAAE